MFEEDNSFITSLGVYSGILCWVILFGFILGLIIGYEYSFLLAAVLYLTGFALTKWLA